MNNGILSQEEIDALMNGGSSSSKKEETKIENVIQEKLSPTEEDIIGEIGNISMSTAATTLSSLLNKKVLITTPRVSLESFKKIIEECKVPKVVANIDFKEGLTGQNLLMMDVTDAKIIADLMMGGDGTKVSENFTELELSAVGEAMNQMIGSASTSMATMLEKSIDILPPEVDVWDKNEEIQTDKFDLSQNIVKVSFDLTVEGLIESEIMQIFTHETVNDMINLVMKDEVKEIKREEIKTEKPDVKQEIKQEVKVSEQRDTSSQVEIKRPVFNELDPTLERTSKPRNLDLIMDVPLEFSVVLGKTKKSIKEVLSFSNGSIVELNKLADEPLEIYVNGKLIAQGEVVVINENFGVRITNILTKEERVQSL